MAILADEIKIKIDGKTLGGCYFTDIQLVQELQKPNELRFHINRRKLSENEKEIRFSLSEELLGKDVDFSLTTIRNKEDRKSENDDLKFTGTIFNVNILRNNLKANTVIEVTAYSRDYVLLDSPNCFSYEKGKLKDIVAQTLKPYDISVKNNPRMEEEIPYTVQYNETSYEFLNRLARRYGEWVYFTNDELVFGKVEKLDSLKLHFGADVVHYKYCLDMEHPNFAHAHHNYLEYGNTQKKGTDFSDNSMHNLTDIVYDQSKSLFSKETFQHLNGSNPEDGFDETETSAKVQGLGKKAQMMICQGKSNRADLRLGSVIKIKEGYDKDEKAGEIAWCFHDELIIHKLVHKVSNKDSYENDFMAVSANCEIPPYNYNDCHPKAEPQRAVVMDNIDPEKLGRVRVQFLWQKEQDENLMSPWIRIAQPYGGDEKGFFFIPEIGEEVMVGFENGNAEKPYVIGTLWHGEQKPREKWYTDFENNDVKAIRTRRHAFGFCDNKDNGYMQMYDNDRNFIIYLDIERQLIKLESARNIELIAKNDIILKAGNNIQIKADADITEKAGGNISETAGNNVNIGAGANLAINAANNMDTSVGGSDTLYITDNQVVDVSGSKVEYIAGKYQLTADKIREEGGSKVEIYGNNIDVKAGSSLKCDGGSLLDLYASSIRIN